VEDRGDDRVDDGAGRTPSRGRTVTRELATGGVAVAAALGVGNVLGYVLTVFGAYTLSRPDFGVLASLLAVYALGLVPAIGLQTVAAIRTAQRGAGRTVDPEVARETEAVGLVVTLGVAVVLLAASPVVAVVLHLDSPLAPAMLALATVPVTLAGVPIGWLQGSRRFTAMAVAHAAVNAGKFGGGLVGLVVGGTPVAVFAGAALVASAAAVLAWVLAAPHGSLIPRLRRPGLAATREAVRASAAMLALLALTSADLLLARHLLAPAAAGVYAVGAVFTKAGFWLPQVVTTLALPRLARGSSRALSVSFGAVGAVAVLFAVLVGAAGPLAVVAVGGSRDPELVSIVGLYAATGGLLAVVHLLVNARLAANHRAVSLPIWAATALEIIVAVTWRPDQVLSLVLLAMGTAVTAGAATAIPVWRARRNLSRTEVSTSP
jgi:O-antigen/teichoic acid export membrane protein